MHYPKLKQTMPNPYLRGTIWKTRGGQLARVIHAPLFRNGKCTKSGYAEIINETDGEFTFFERGRWAAGTHEMDLMRLVAQPVKKKHHA